MCAVGGSLLLLGSLGSAIQVSLAPRSWPAPSRTPLRAGDSQSGGRGSGKRSRVLEVTSKWERWARVQVSCCQGPVSRYLSRLGRFRHRLRAGPAGQVLEAPPAAVSSLLRDQRWVLVSPP